MTVFATLGELITSSLTGMNCRIEIHHMQVLSCLLFGKTRLSHY